MTCSSSVLQTSLPVLMIKVKCVMPCCTITFKAASLNIWQTTVSPYSTKNNLWVWPCTCLISNHRCFWNAPSLYKLFPGKPRPAFRNQIEGSSCVWSIPKVHIWWGEKKESEIFLFTQKEVTAKTKCTNSSTSIVHIRITAAIQEGWWWRF